MTMKEFEIVSKRFEAVRKLYSNVVALDRLNRLLIAEGKPDKIITYDHLIAIGVDSKAILMRGNKFTPKQINKLLQYMSHELSRFTVLIKYDNRGHKSWD